LSFGQTLRCAPEYICSKGLSARWTKNCKNSLAQFRRFLRLKRGLDEQSKVRLFDIPNHTQGLPEWLVNELERYQRLLQRTAGLEYSRLLQLACPYVALFVSAVRGATIGRPQAAVRDG
jgi:hypothetical protein